jgi:transcriptional regulator with XRE-family HTH domain
MTTRKKSAAQKFLESVAGEPLTLGALLAAIREGEELSQAEFARRLGISRSHLCDIEKGRKMLAPARAAKFAAILGYSEAQFVRLALQSLVSDAGLRLRVTVEAA